MPLGRNEFKIVPGKVNYDTRVIIAGVLNEQYPGFGCCYRCNLPWDVAVPHETIYSEISRRACFPLCQDCWTELQPDARIAYYRRLWHFWQGITNTTAPENMTWDELWNDIEKAVLQEGA